MAKDTPDPTAGRPFVLAVDPGRANGVCLVQREGLVKLYSGELDWPEMTRYVASTCLELGTELDVVAEAFRISVQTAKNGVGANETIEAIGMIRLLVRQYSVSDGLNLPLQSTGDAQEFTDGDKLRALGWWHKSGKGHANMALRHAALRLLRTGVRDRALLGLE